MRAAPTPGFRVCPDQEAPELPSPSGYLSLPWTGLLVCRGVEGLDSSEEALHWASRGDRGRVLCPLGLSLQDTGSGDSAGKVRGGAVSQEEPLLSGLALSHSVPSPTIFQSPPLPWALPIPVPSPADAKGPAGARCPGGGYLSPPSSAGIS